MKDILLRGMEKIMFLKIIFYIHEFFKDCFNVTLDIIICIILILLLKQIRCYFGKYTRFEVSFPSALDKFLYL